MIVITKSYSYGMLSSSPVVGFISSHNSTPEYE